MKFISKFSNYRVVLRSGIPGNRNTGKQAIPGLYVKFESGEAEVNDKETIRLLTEHPSYIKEDVIAAPDGGNDPFYANRESIEPAHNLTNIEYGHVGESVSGPVKPKFSDVQRKAMKEIASELASDLVAKMLPMAVENEIKRRDFINSVENVPVISQNEKLTAPEPEEDEAPVATDVSDGKAEVVKEEVKIGGVEKINPEDTTKIDPKAKDSKVIEDLNKMVKAPKATTKK